MTLLTIEIRPAEPSDAEAISEVHAKAWQYAYGGLIPHGALRRMIERRSGQWWNKAIRRGTSIEVVEMAGSVCGYVTFGLNRARALPQDGEIYELYLLPEYQGIGLGKRLFASARQTLLDHGCKGLVVWALEDNDNARHFYNALGGADIAQGVETFDGKTLHKLAFVWA